MPRCGLEARVVPKTALTMSSVQHFNRTYRTATIPLPNEPSLKFLVNDSRKLGIWLSALNKPPINEKRGCSIDAQFLSFTNLVAHSLGIFCRVEANIESLCI